MHARVGEIQKVLLVQTLVPQLAVETLDVGVIDRLSGADEIQGDLLRAGPAQERGRGYTVHRDIAMSIRHIPFDALTASHFHDLVARQARENETLEFKRTLHLEGVRPRVAFLQDVIAMANASGGMIIYGAEEGEGDDRGALVSLHGMRGAADQTQQLVGHLLRDGIDEPLHGVQHRAVPLEDGTYLYVVRIPPSPLAPHQVTLAEARWRYFLRSGTSNNPMNARQVKEAVLRSATAVDRVRHRIEQRVDVVREYAATATTPSAPAERTPDGSVVLVHFVPLYARPGAIDLANDHLSGRLKEALPHGSPYIGNLRWTLEGLYTESQTNGYRDHWALMLRDGALEFGQIGVLNGRPAFVASGAPIPRFLDVTEFEGGVRRSAQEAERLCQNGWLTAPFVLSVRLLNVGSAYLGSTRNYSFGNGQRLTVRDIPIEPEIVLDWGSGLQDALRRIFDTVWQAFGFKHSSLSARKNELE